MSAPLGRVVDRHIKLIRYRNHPLVTAGDKLKEPLLHLVAGKAKTVDENAKRRRQKSRANSNRKKGNKTKKDNSKSSNESKENAPTYASAEGLECPTCGSDIITKSGPRKKICTVCRHQWV